MLQLGCTSGMQGPPFPSKAPVFFAGPMSFEPTLEQKAQIPFLTIVEESYLLLNLCLLDFVTSEHTFKINRRQLS